MFLTYILCPVFEFPLYPPTRCPPTRCPPTRKPLLSSVPCRQPCEFHTHTHKQSLRRRDIAALVMDKHLPHTTELCVGRRHSRKGIATKIHCMDTSPQNKPRAVRRGRQCSASKIPAKGRDYDNSLLLLCGYLRCWSWVLSL